MLKTFKKISSKRVQPAPIYWRYIPSSKKPPQSFPQHRWHQCRGQLMINRLLPGYCFEVRAEWLEERKSEISCMYYNNSMKWNMLQHYNKYQNNQDFNSVTKWIRYIAKYLSLPSGSDISRYILNCRAIAIYGLLINLRYIYKRVSSLVPALPGCYFRFLAIRCWF